MKISLQHIRDIDKFFSSKQYDRAIELLEKLVEKNPKEDSLRMKLADAYYLYGRNSQAVAVLKQITEEYARNGFITKAMALHKRIQKIDPSVDIDIYSLLEESEGEEPLLETPPVHGGAANEPEQPGPETQNRFRALDNLFSGLPREEFKSINKQLDEVSKSTGADVFKQGSEDNSLYIIITGMVRVHTVHNDKHIDLARLSEGSFFGEVALLTGKARTATVTCEEDSTFLVLDRNRYLKLSSKYPDIKKNLARALENRAQNTIEKIIETEMES